MKLETLLTSPRFFGLTTATPVQRAKCRIFDGAPLGDLAEHPDVLDMLGGEYPAGSAPPREVLDISASRVGKSLFGAALIITQSQTVDLSHVSRGDIVRIHVAALKLDGTRAVMTHLVEQLVAKPALRALLVDRAEDVSPNGVRLRHPSGRIIEVTPTPIDRAGGSALSVYSAGVVVDEYPRMLGADDGVRNVDHFRDAVLGRMLPGAVFLATGSPWQPFGPAYDAVVEHFGRPTRDLVVLRTRGPVANPTWWTPERCAELERRNPLAYRTDCLAEFADGESTVFPSSAIEAACGPREGGDPGQLAIFADPSALRHDTWAVMVAGWESPDATPEDIYQVEQLGETLDGAGAHDGKGPIVRGRNGWIRYLLDEHGRCIERTGEDSDRVRSFFRVHEVVSWDRSSGARGLDIIREVGRLARRYGARDFFWDGFEQLMIADLVRREGLRPRVLAWSQSRKTEAVDRLRTLLVDRLVALPRHAALKQELLRYRARATPGGAFSYVVAGGAGHGDHASCLLLAMRADLDGYVDRSPHAVSRVRHEIWYSDAENDEADEEYEAAFISRIEAGME